MSMKKHLLVFLGIYGMIACAFAEFFPVDELEPGMIGIARTVFQGTEPDTFSVEIIGVMKNVAPNRDVILARGISDNIRATGIAAGMSGSPVYIDGKLLGAIAYTWSFAREPLMGITPAEQMVKLEALYGKVDRKGFKVCSRDFGVPLLSDVETVSYTHLTLPTKA